MSFLKINFLRIYWENLDIFYILVRVSTNNDTYNTTHRQRFVSEIQTGDSISLLIISERFQQCPQFLLLFLAGGLFDALKKWKKK